VGLVAHTVAMFSFATVYTATGLDLQSISYIDNRDFPGIEGVLSPGPLGYEFLIYSNAINVVPTLMFQFNNWLADGLLLYRCFVIYAMNYWAIAFPCLMYLASIATGIVFTYYQATQPDTSYWTNVAFNFNYPYFSISLSLNVLLTLMIVVKLVMHTRNIRKAIGAPTGTSGLCNAVVTILVESCALYATNYLLFIGAWGAQSHVSDIFFPLLADTQVIATFLIVIRVANRSALTSNTIVSGNMASIQFRSEGKSTNGNVALPDEHSVGSMDAYEGALGELGVGIEKATDLPHDKV